jgi:hypothetical protein
MKARLFAEGAHTIELTRPAMWLGIAQARRPTPSLPTPLLDHGSWVVHNPYA